MKKILLIDDSSFARNAIKRLLGEGYEFYEAQDGLSGLESYFLNKPDLVILDITMPGVSGLEILDQLRKLDAQARVVICTADVQSYSRARALELGASAFIEKPVNAAGLQEAVHHILEEGA